MFMAGLNQFVFVFFSYLHVTKVMVREIAMELKSVAYIGPQFGFKNRKESW